MKEYLNQSKFAELLGVTRQAIHVAIKEGRVVRTSRGIDPTHPTNEHFIRKFERRREEKKRKKKQEAARKAAKLNAEKKKKTTASKKKSKAKETKKQKEKIKAALKKGDTDTKDNPSKQNGFSNFDKHENWLSRESAEHKKILEQVRKLQVDTDEKRRQLVSRDSVRRVFGKLYLIDTNEFKTLGDTLTPQIMAICGVDDPELQIEINQLVEAECYKVLAHIKRLMNDFLKKVEADPVEELE